jgi:NAD(P)-dependent dehydrogenase (short-subunit alcohol dehydrogenase family)
MRRLEGRVAVVTGAASGIGRAMAARFAAEGMRVVLADVDKAGLRLAEQDIRVTGAPAVALPTDVSDEGQVRALAELTISEFGAVHVVCNNAGVESGARFSEIPIATWEWVMNVNFWGVLHGCRAFLPLLRAQDEGHIVNTGSVGSFSSGMITMAPYAVSKWAVLALSENLELELRAGGEPIGVSVLAPGPTRTQMPYAERNRPDGVPSTSDDPERRQMTESLLRLTDDIGLEPEHVAGLVVDAIRQRRFFVLPHPEQAITAVRNRLHWMESGDPQPVRRL